VKKLLLVLALAGAGLAVVDARADVKATIEGIERMPRRARLAAYESAIADRKIMAQDRVELIRAFARHAQALSPVYGKDRFGFDDSKWATTLKQGFDADPRDADIAQALTQLLIDRNDLPGALPVARAFRAAHPQNHYAVAWSAWCESPKTLAANPKPGELPIFPVHFIVLTRNPQAHRVATLAQCRKECDILNATFRTLDGKPLVRFEFKGYASYQDIKQSASELLAYGDRTEQYDTDDVAKAFNACKDRRVRDPQAINFYIYDSHSAKGGFGDTTSHGKRNSNRPFVLIDWERLNNKIQNAEAHEMGHAFGLEHIGVPGAGENTSTNIMASASEQFGSGGKRDLGFSPSQSALILYHARRTFDRLRSAP
jgi:hypothetical protein